MRRKVLSTRPSTARRWCGCSRVGVAQAHDPAPRLAEGDAPGRVHLVDHAGVIAAAVAAAQIEEHHVAHRRPIRGHQVVADPHVGEERRHRAVRAETQAAVLQLPLHPGGGLLVAAQRSRAPARRGWAGAHGRRSCAGRGAPAAASQARSRRSPRRRSRPACRRPRWAATRAPPRGRPRSRCAATPMPAIASTPVDSRRTIAATVLHVGRLSNFSTLFWPRGSGAGGAACGYHHEMREVVIIGAARTPIGAFQGALSEVPAPRLGGVALRAALERASTGALAEKIDEVIMGCVLPAGQGQAPARQAAHQAGLPRSVGAVTINKVCGSGLKAVALAAQRHPHRRRRIGAGRRDGVDVPVAVPAAQGARGDAARPRRRCSTR